MAVQFILGCAGTGKTRLCLDELISESQRQPLGPSLYWLVPEQATFMCERLLLADGRLAGSFRIKVLGFRGLVRVLAEELGIDVAAALTPLQRTIVLADVVDSCREKLTIFKAAANQPGFVRTLDATLRELVQNGHTAQSLAALHAKVVNGGSGALGLASKLHDLSRLLAAWQEATKSLQDADKLPQIIAEKLADKPTVIKGARFWVDAFSAFNRVELSLLAALGRAAESVQITLLLDPDSTAMKSAQQPPSGLFARTETMYRRLLHAFELGGVSVKPPMALRTQHRLAASPVLQHLEQILVQDAAGAIIEKASTPQTQAASAITLWPCDNPQAEALSAARYIRDAVTGGKARYRDIGIIVSDLEGYQDALSRTMQAHNIPHFIDRRRPLKYHPVVELIAGALAVVSGGYRRVDILVLLKTGLAGLSDGEVNELENYMLAHGIDGDDFSKQWKWSAGAHSVGSAAADTLPNDALARINTLRLKFRTQFGQWFKIFGDSPEGASAAGDKKYDGGQLAKTLIALLAQLRVKEKLDSWITEAAQRGDQESVLIHQQAWVQLCTLLDELGLRLARHPVTLAAFQRNFSWQVETLTLGLVPPAIDQVLISSVHRSRHPELQTVIVLGAVETQMPQVTSEDPMFNDQERSEFNTLGAGPINPGARDSLLEAPFFDYVAFTRAAQRLIVSWPLADTAGNEVKPSGYIDRFKQTFGDCVVGVPPAAESKALACAGDATAAVLAWTRLHSQSQPQRAARMAPTATELSADTIATLARWLYAQAAEPVQQAARLAWTALTPRAVPQQWQPIGSSEAPQTIRASLSELETYATCPLQHFYKYHLRLTERDRPMVDETSRGLLYHQALEQVFKEVIAGTLPWPEANDQQIEDALRRALDDVFNDVAEAVLQADAEVLFLRIPMHRHLLTALTNHRNAACQGELRPVKAEVKFGTDDATPALKIPLSSGGTLQIIGKIDRIDADAAGNTAVLDYKTSTQKFDFAAFEGGTNLQLPAYMLAAANFTVDDHKLYPMAGLLTSIESPVAKDGEEPQPPKMRGFFNLDKADLLAPVAPGEAAVYFMHRLTKAGAPDGRSSDAVTSEQFAAILRYTQMHLASLGNSIAQHMIQPAPVRSGTYKACSHCSFTAICPFDRIRGTFRRLPGGRRKEILSRLTVGGKAMEVPHA